MRINDFMVRYIPERRVGGGRAAHTYRSARRDAAKQFYREWRFTQ